MIEGIYLAAGAGRRFGGDKLLCDVGGKPLFYHGLRACVESSLARVHAVYDSRNTSVETAMRRRLAGEQKVSLVPHDHPDRGMMSSLKRGLLALDAGCAGAMILLADMPGVTPHIIDTLVRRFEGGIVIPTCGGEWRHPRIIPRRLFGEFLELGDDEKGTEVLTKYSRLIVTVAVGAAANYADIDSPRDLDSLA